MDQYKEEKARNPHPWEESENKEALRAVDERENQYAEFAEPLAGNKVIKKDNGREFFKKIIDRTRNLLI